MMAEQLELFKWTLQQLDPRMSKAECYDVENCLRRAYLSVIAAPKASKLEEMEGMISRWLEFLILHRLSAELREVQSKNEARLLSLRRALKASEGLDDVLGKLAV